jgi:hypothetical protein
MKLRGWDLTSPTLAAGQFLIDERVPFTENHMSVH